MATYTCEIWKNKGFDTVNVPQKMSLLGTPAYTTQAMSLEQGMLLTEINVKINEDLASAATFVKLTNNEKSNISMVYNVQGYQMLAGDTAKLSIVPNFFCSLRETDKIIAKGITERVSVLDDYTGDKDEGVWGKYMEDDEYLFPIYPLVARGNSKVMFDDASNKKLFVVSTLDLEKTIRQETIQSETGESYTYNYLPVVDEFTKFYDEDGSLKYTENSTGVFDYSKTNIKKNIGFLRSNGQDSAIIASYEIPDLYLNSKPTVSGRYYKMYGRVNQEATDFKYYWSDIAKYKKILTQKDACKLVIITASGDKLECDLEDIAPLSDYSVNKNTTIDLVSFSDVQPDGAPYFAPRWYHGRQATVKPHFPFSWIRGLQWRNVPIRYEEKSGTALTQARYQTSRALADTQYNIAKEQQILDTTMGLMGGSTGNLINSVATGAYSASNISTPAGAGGYLAKKAPEIFGNVRNFFGSMFQFDLNKKNLKQTYLFNAVSDLQELVFQTKYVVPEINFPFSANYIRDYIGNGAYCYLLTISSEDVFRWNRILTRYGHKFTEMFEIDILNLNLFNDEGYYYFKAKSVDFTSDLPIWFLEGLKIQLMAGIRVHKKLPE